MSNNDQNIAFAPLGTLANSAKGKKPPVLKEKSAASLVPYIDIEAFENGVFRRYTDPAKTVLCEDGDVLMVWDGSRSGLVGRGRAGAIGSTLAKIDVPLVKKSYLFYFLESLYPILNSRAKGVGIPHVNPELLWSSLFPVVSEKQQERVVTKIEELITEVEAGIKELEAAQAELKRYRASVLAAACSGTLVPTEAELARSEGRSYENAADLLERVLRERREKWNGRGKYKEPAASNAAGLPPLPEGWVWTRAEQLCDFITKGTTPSKEKMFSGKGDVPFIKVYNLTDSGSLDFTVKPTFIKNSTHNGELARSKVLPGDVLMNIVGPPLGKVSVIPATYQEWNINQAVAIFRAMPSYNRHFLALCLLNESILQWAIRRSKATAGQFNLTLEICRDLPLPLPPLAEQERIVAEVERRLSVAEEIGQVLSANLQRAERLRQSILQQAFSGKLVPQDDGDESATVLLERISAARVDVVPRKKVTSKTRSRPKAKAK